MGRFIAVLSLLMFFGLVLLIFPPLRPPLFLVIPVSAQLIGLLVGFFVSLANDDDGPAVPRNYKKSRHSTTLQAF